MVINASTKKRLEAILAQKDALKETKTEIKDAIKQLASEMSVKPAVVTKILGFVEKERAKEGVISEEMEILTAAENVG